MKKPPKGILPTPAGGFRAFVRVRPFPVVAKTFPPGTLLQEVQDWRTEKRIELGSRRGPRGHRSTVATGWFRDDVQAYLVKKALLPSIKSLRSEMAAWVALYGDLRTYSLIADHVERARQTWTIATPPYAPRTIDHRVRALRGFFHTMFGKRTSTPADDIRPLVDRKRIGSPRAIDDDVIKTVARALKRRGDALTFSRFLVLTATGRRPSELRRAVPIDVDLKRRVWYVRTGKGGHPTPYALNDDGIAAFRVFTKVDGFTANNRFSGSDYAKILYDAGWPQDWDTSTRRRRNRLRPYQARHSVAIALGEAGADWQDISDSMGHERVATTKAFYTGVIPSRLRQVAATLNEVRPLGYARLLKDHARTTPVIPINALPRGIVRYATAYRASVRVRPYGPVFRQFDLDTPIAVIQKWRQDERAKYLSLKARQAAIG